MSNGCGAVLGAASSSEHHEHSTAESSSDAELSSKVDSVDAASASSTADACMTQQCSVSTNPCGEHAAASSGTLRTDECSALPQAGCRADCQSEAAQASCASANVSSTASVADVQRRRCSQYVAGISVWQAEGKSAQDTDEQLRDCAQHNDMLTSWQRAQAKLDAALCSQRSVTAAREVAAQRQLAAHARRNSAARRIQRCWRCWHTSSAYARRMQALIRVQGSVRAWRMRRCGRIDALRAAARHKVRRLQSLLS